MNPDQDRIENLKKKLYSLTDTPQHKLRGNLHKHASLVRDEWANEGESLDAPITTIDGILSHHGENANPNSPSIGHTSDPWLTASADHNTGDKRGKFLKRVLLLAFFGLLAAVIFVWYMYSSGNTYVSGSNIDVKVIGPVTTPSGEGLVLDVDVTNRNTSDLESVDLVVNYPEGSRQVGDRMTTVLSDRFPIGVLKKGETVRKRVEVIVFGEENVKKELKFTVQYRVPGSVILFNTNKDYPLFIGSSPINISVSTWKEVSPNQTTSFKAKITSNSDQVIHNLLVNTAYPSGFAYERAIPAPAHNNNTWAIGDLNPGDEREIEIFGKILGNADIERYFTFTAGTEDPQDNSKILVKLIETKEQVSIKKPFLAADVSLDRSGDAVYVGQAGDSIRGEIVWQNNLQVPLYDVIIEAKLGGASLDKATVGADRGFYNSSTNTITWDNSTIEEMKEISPGTSGILNFSFASVQPTAKNNATLRRQTLTLDVTVKAKRLSEAQVPEEIKSTTSREIKIATGLQVNSILVRNSGPFENTGPIPPSAEQKTTYTVMNSVSNSFNNLKNVTYTVTLPSYVKWIDVVHPESARSNIKYNADKREVTWSLGDIAPGTGYNSSPKEFAFQVEFLPSISQVGTTPVIVNPGRIAGTDTFTNSIIETVLNPLDTRIQFDPKFNFGWEKVVR